ncbi:DUF4429 domain-containing protein [Actinomadura spongiicola]|uniref:DUF4429 domain-containing protein n=1 Tax=Actinomadura spongiicola TaxID=2303421 RepID=A0A372GC59_9ACTN|nr:DUF4429 domain-containing protein [Actinomadura spongiicola]RFS82732.1 DUF4429 domain-containing protein [Actinomadura spongiicola]
MKKEAKFRRVRFGWDGQSVSLDYSTDIYEKLFPTYAHIARGIRSLHIPVTALADVKVEPPLGRLDGYITLVPRQGASALHTAVSSHLLPAIDPLGFNFSSKQKRLTKRYVEELRRAIQSHGLADTPAKDFLIHYPERVTQCVGRDGSMHLDGDTVTISWAAFADHSKRSQGPHWRIPISALESVNWQPGRNTAGGYGFVQLRLSGAPPQLEVHPAEDVNAILLESEESHANGVLIATTLLQRMQRTDTCPAPSILEVWTQLYSSGSKRPAPQEGNDPVKRLHRLGELRDAGLLTEDEFQAMKKEILDRL